MPRDSTLNYVSKKTKTERTPFIITHDPTHPPLDKWLKERMTTLHQSRRIKKAMPQPPIVGERNCHNLRRMLMPTKPPPPPPEPETPLQENQTGCHKCQSKRCVVCQQHLKQTTTFNSVRTGTTFNIRTPANCKTSNLIYLIDCDKCGDVQYVGETGQTLQRRFHAHRSNIGVDPSKKKEQSKNTNSDFKRPDTLVARHFQSDGHSLQDMRVTVIETMRSDDAASRKSRERFWRHKLKTNYPDGLNVYD
jgi:hypothetical protein